MGKLDYLESEPLPTELRSRLQKDFGVLLGQVPFHPGFECEGPAFFVSSREKGNLDGVVFLRGFQGFCLHHSDRFLYHSESFLYDSETFEYHSESFLYHSAQTDGQTDGYAGCYACDPTRMTF